MKRAVCVGLALVLGLVSGAASAQKKAIRIAVMDFTPGTGDVAMVPLGKGLQAMISTDLSNVASITVVERARLRDIQSELALQQTAAFDKETAVKVGGLSGASHLLVGAFTVVNGRMRLDARLLSATSAEPVLNEKSEGTEAQFFELEGQLVKKVVDSLSIKLQKAEKAALGKPQTTSLVAFQKLGEGIDAFDDKHTDVAVAAMQAAVAADPGFSLASQKLAELQLALPNMKMPEIKKPEAQCQQNPLQTPACQPPAGQPAVDLRSPTMFLSDGKKPYGIIVRSGTDTAACITPCELHLPKGKVDIEVTSPVHYRKVLDAPGGPASIQVRHLNKTNIIIGGVLGGLTIALVATAVGFHESTATIDGGMATGGTTLQQYWTVPLALASGMVFPTVYYLMQMGKNDVRLMTP